MNSMIPSCPVFPIQPPITPPLSLSIPFSSFQQTLHNFSVNIIVCCDPADAITTFLCASAALFT